MIQFQNLSIMCRLQSKAIIYQQRYLSHSTKWIMVMLTNRTTDIGLNLWMFQWILIISYNWLENFPIAIKASQFVDDLQSTKFVLYFRTQGKILCKPFQKLRFHLMFRLTQSAWTIFWTPKISMKFNKQLNVLLLWMRRRAKHIKNTSLESTQNINHSLITFYYLLPQ